jgi:hypothetical protein
MRERLHALPLLLKLALMQLSELAQRAHHLFHGFHLSNHWSNSLQSADPARLGAQGVLALGAMRYLPEQLQQRQAQLQP